MDHAYWLPNTSNVIPILGSEGQSIENIAKTKETNVGTIAQPAMASFANIFAGASAAIASSTNIIDVNPDLLQTGKNLMVSPSVPPTNHVEIQPANQLSKRSGVFPIACTLPGMATISNIGLANANMIISGTPAQLTGDIQQITSGQITFASAPQMTVAISKDFIQQAAAESGVTIGLNNNNAVQAQIYPEQPLIPASNAATLTSELTPVTFNQDPNAELEKPIKCPECDMTFKQTGALTYHTFVAHAQLQDRPHKCAVCPESFLAAHHLQDHIKAVHCAGVDNQASTNLTCSECHMTFNNGGCLNYHIYITHTLQGSSTLQHMCRECGKSFMKANLLTAHIKNVHGNVVNVPTAPTVIDAQPPAKQYPCQSCDKVFKLPQQLKQHALSSHDKPHKCEICGKGFGRKSDLNRHTRGVHMRERPHSCNKCGWTFAEAGNLKHHTQAVHSKEKNFRCTICSRSFSMASYLKTHMIRVHGMVESTKTDTAATVSVPVTSSVVTMNHQQQPNYLTTADNITAIVSIPQAQVTTRCFECGEVFANAAMLQNHVMSTHPQPFWCTVCGEGFSQAYQLQNHLQMRHSDSNTNPNINNVNQVPISQPVQTNSIPANISTPQTTAINDQVNPQTERCSGCGILLEKGRKEHICPGVNKYQQVALNAAAAMAMAGERPHLCTKCGKGFKTATHLKQHVRCVHTKDRPHKCQRCAKSFARMSDLNRHVKGVHEKLKSGTKALRLTNSKCSECGASFSEISHLKRHFLTIHLNQRPSFKCADCQEGFPNDQAFKNHICHERERPHTCNICSKRFAEVTQLRRHMRSAHNQLNPRNKHRCEQCRRNFTRPVDLERHIHAVHLKEKPHECQYCHKLFGLHGNLNKHIRAVHMMEKPHQCIECGKCFAHIGVLKRHLRDIHFYDRRPAHNNPKLKAKRNNPAPSTTAVQNGPVQAHVVQAVPQDGNRQPDDVSHLVVLQALDSSIHHDPHQLIAQNVHAQPNISHPPAPHPPQIVQSPQVITDSLPPPPPPTPI